MVGIVAVLARSGDDRSMAYLRTVWDRNPERREPVAMGLSQAPHGDNWEYLVRSLPILESVTLREVIRRLVSVDQIPDDPEHVRQLRILASQGLTWRSAARHHGGSAGLRKCLQHGSPTDHVFLGSSGQAGS